MQTVLIAAGAFVFYLIAYHTYGRWLARRIFSLDPEARTPAFELRDDVDYVPSRKDVVFGHHFTSIAGTGPIVGPAIAIIWGWVPALLWVLIGSVVMGAVHDFGAVVMSLRHKGITIADYTGSIIGRRARHLFLAVVFFELLIVIAIFALVIAKVFEFYPHAVIPVWLEIPIAVVLGMFIARAKSTKEVVIASLIAVLVMYVTVLIGSMCPVTMGSLGRFPPTFLWAIILFVYAFSASVLPVQTLLQPRDYINSHQLFIAMGLLILGVLVARPEIVAPAVQTHFEGSAAHPFFPFLFITIACGAISGFHSLVGSGTSSKQLSHESDAQLVGYGSMLTEGFLAVLVIIAVAAGIGMNYSAKFTVSGEALNETPELRQMSDDLLAGREAVPPRKEVVAGSEQGKKALKALTTMAEFRRQNPSAALTVASGKSLAANIQYEGKLQGKNAWAWHYRSWDAAKGLGDKLRAFVDGSANMLQKYGIPLTIGLAIMGVFVASFAGTTLDTATRLQRYVISEWGQTAGIKPLQNRYVATGVAVVSAGLLALWDGKGAGALILWPLFGALNQLLASLGLLVIAIYLYRKEKPTWMVTLPLVFMLVMTAWAMTLNFGNFLGQKRWHLLIITGIVLALQVWIVIEAILCWAAMRRERAETVPVASEGDAE